MIDNLAESIRFTLCDVSNKTKTPHLGSCLSSVEILVSLYWKVMNIDPKAPDAEDRDYFLLGKGHAANVLYTTLAYRGYFDIEELYSHGKDNSDFEEHPGVAPPKGVEHISGSLGHALPVATGMALSSKIKSSSNKFYALIGDGELNEGTIWEAALFAAKHNLSNLVAIVDFNKLQGTGPSCEIMQLEPLEKKWEAFGWNTIRVDGHDIDALTQAFVSSNNQNKPTCIIADTIKGKGISFMEGDNNWHYRIPNDNELISIEKELF